MILVKVCKLGAPITEVALENNSTVADALEAAGEEFVNRCVTRNHNQVDEYDTVYNGDRIFVGEPCKGNNTFEVKFMILGSSVIAVTAQSGMTIDSLVRSLSDENRSRFLTSDGKHIYEYRIRDSNPLGENYVLNQPADGSALRITMSTRTKGNE